MIEISYSRVIESRCWLVPYFELLRLQPSPCLTVQYLSVSVKFATESTKEKDLLTDHHKRSSLSGVRRPLHRRYFLPVQLQVLVYYWAIDYLLLLRSLLSFLMLTWASALFDFWDIVIIIMLSWNSDHRHVKHLLGITLKVFNSRWELLSLEFIKTAYYIIMEVFVIGEKVICMVPVTIWLEKVLYLDLLLTGLRGEESLLRRVPPGGSKIWLSTVKDGLSWIHPWDIIGLCSMTVNPRRSKSFHKGSSFSHKAFSLTAWTDALVWNCKLYTFERWFINHLDLIRRGFLGHVEVRMISSLLVNNLIKFLLEEVILFDIVNLNWRNNDRKLRLVWGTRWFS